MNKLSEFRSGFVAIIGLPNVGKSTLLNSLINQNLSIVTPKPQTTRNKILGISSDNNSQIVFIDTPGLLKPEYLLQQVMMNYATSATKDSDLILYIVDAKEVNNVEKLFPIKLNLNKNQKSFLVINKIDLLKKEETLELINKLSQLLKWDEIIPVSAIKKYNLEELKKVITKYLPIHEPYYDTEQLSDKSEKFFVSEMIRENIFKLFTKEVPYSTTVSIIEFKERTKNKFYIHAEIIVERKSQKIILIGKKGASLKKLGELSRKRIEEFLEHQVYLELFVKVRENWRNSKNRLSEFGYSEE
ncbi:MAG: GTPase Era [Bacteroidetes bacterium]|nr:GTPase Era [Bacteroidota bacterium]